MTTTTLSIGLAFLAGLVTVSSPCILPILPILVGRSLTTHRTGPLFLMAGLILSFAVAGSLIGISTRWLAGLMSWLRITSIAMLLGLGLLILFPHWRDRLMHYFAISRWFKTSERTHIWHEFWLGCQLGLLWTPCAGTVLGGILLLSVNQNMGLAFVLLCIYALGAALPMLAIAYGGKFVGRSLLKLRVAGDRMHRIGGGIIVGSAIGILLGWDVQLQLRLAPFFPKQLL